jgi:hypothetical protein
MCVTHSVRFSVLMDSIFLLSNDAGGAIELLVKQCVFDVFNKLRKFVLFQISYLPFKYLITTNNQDTDITNRYSYI